MTKLEVSHGETEMEHGRKGRYYPGSMEEWSVGDGTLSARMGFQHGFIVNGV